MHFNHLKSYFTSRPALLFVILLGFVSMFADVTYEGARSITGPYLAILGASAITVGFVAGFGELMGYALRIFSGFIADKTTRYWLISFIGYFINLLSVPLLAFTHSWIFAAFLIILERVGKAIRTPARDAMLSYASHQTGRGWGFGLHEFLDKFGAMAGPILVAGILWVENNYRLCFIILFIPALFALLTLLIAWRIFPSPRHLEKQSHDITVAGIPRLFWIYLMGASLIAMGYVDFPLIAYHFKKINLPAVWIPSVYAMAMGIDAISALIVGYLYDHHYKKILIIVIGMCAFATLMVFDGNIYLILIGMMLWGIGLELQSSFMKTLIADMVAVNIRGSVYGIFNTVFGIAWFLGSLTLGILYNISFVWLIAFSLSTQLMAIPFFVIIAVKMGWFDNK